VATKGPIREKGRRQDNWDTIVKGISLSGNEWPSSQTIGRGKNLPVGTPGGTETGGVWRDLNKPDPLKRKEGGKPESVREGGVRSGSTIVDPWLRNPPWGVVKKEEIMSFRLLVPEKGETRHQSDEGSMRV